MISSSPSRSEVASLARLLFPEAPPTSSGCGTSQLDKKADMRVASSSETEPVSCMERRRTEAAFDSTGFCRARNNAELPSAAATSGDITAFAGARAAVLLAFVPTSTMVVCDTTDYPALALVLLARDGLASCFLCFLSTFRNYDIRRLFFFHTNCRSNAKIY